MWSKKYIEGLLSLAYPKSCFGCKRPVDHLSYIYLCTECWNELAKDISPPFCMICGRPIDISPHQNLWCGDISDVDLDLSPGSLADRCSDCIGYRWYFSRGYTAALYEGLVKDCIHSYKYNYNTYLAGTLTKLMIDFSLRYIELGKIDVLVPVPLHWRKLRQRGFNQAELLAKGISVGVGVPVVKRGLHRIRHVPSQTELPRQERLDNIKGVFTITRPECFVEKRILLIDDVFTTGATLNECSRVIMEAGAREVWVFSLARGLNY